MVWKIQLNGKLTKTCNKDLLDINLFEEGDSIVLISKNKDNELKNDVNAFVEQESQYLQNNSKLFSILLDQFTDGMRAKLKALPNFNTVSNEFNGIKLLQMAKEVSYAFEGKRYSLLSVYTSLHKFFQFYQCDNMSVENYYDFSNQTLICLNIAAHQLATVRN